MANFYRPLTRTPQEALEVMGEIEAACGIRFTCIVNNSNLGGLTAPEDVLATHEKALQLSRLSGLPLWMTTAAETVCAGLPDAFPLHLQKKYYDIKEN